MSDNIWMIRAGEGGYRISEFAKGYVAIGWAEMGDLTALNTQEAVKQRYREAYPQAKPGRVDGSACSSGSLVGMDRSAAKAAFATFTERKNFTANQLEFINMIVDHLSAQGLVK
jgi:hypothetical protein